MNLDQIIALAAAHSDNGAPMASSAKLCLSDAQIWRDEGKLIESKARALRSLQYSIGIMHRDYIRAARVPVEHMCDAARFGDACQHC